MNLSSYRFYKLNHVVCVYPTNFLGDNVMAKNTGDGWRRGEVRDRSQVKNPRTDSWTKRGPNGQFMNGKADGKPFKGVRKER